MMYGMNNDHIKAVRMSDGSLRKQSSAIRAETTLEALLIGNVRIGQMTPIDPFQNSLPCWDHKSATAYAIRSYQERELAEIKSCTDSIDKVLNNEKMNDQQQVLMISFIIKQILKNN